MVAEYPPQQTTWVDTYINTRVSYLRTPGMTPLQEQDLRTALEADIASKQARARAARNTIQARLAREAMARACTFADI